LADPTARPELHPAVAARLHVSQGEARVVLTDTRDGQELVIGEREWAALRCADSSRDIDGVRVALQARGRRVSSNDLGGFFAELARLGMLRGPEDEDARPASHAAPIGADEAARPLRGLAGYRFVCRGQGHCCETYGSIIFTPEEELRARSACPDILDGDHSRERLFAPERGIRDLGASCVARVDGGCAYFIRPGGCAVHHAKGLDAKPKGCQFFPLVCADDGENIHLSVRPECACVFDSLTETEAPTLLEGVLGDSSSLPAWVPIYRIPERIAWTSADEISRAEFRQRRDALVSQIDDDVARSLWDTGKMPASGDVRDATAPESGLVALTDTLDGLLGRRGLWDAEGTYVMSTLRRWSEAMKKWVATGDPPPPPIQPAEERFALRALAYGDALIRRGSVSEELCRTALLIWSARIIGRYPADHGSKRDEQPLALSFSLAQASGLWDHYAPTQKSGPRTGAKS